MKQVAAELFGPEGKGARVSAARRPHLSPSRRSKFLSHRTTRMAQPPYAPNSAAPGAPEPNSSRSCTLHLAPRFRAWKRNRQSDGSDLYSLPNRRSMILYFVTNLQPMASALPVTFPGYGQDSRRIRPGDGPGQSNLCLSPFYWHGDFSMDPPPYASTRISVPCPVRAASTRRTSNFQ